jgi:hypothetical protein
MQQPVCPFFIVCRHSGMRGIFNDAVKESIASSRTKTHSLGVPLFSSSQTKRTCPMFRTMCPPANGEWQWPNKSLSWLEMS